MATRRRRVFLGLAFLVAALAFTRSTFRANEHSGCADVNNSGNNRVTVFEVLDATGELKPVEEIATGGLGANGGYFSIPQIVSSEPKSGRACVFAANAATDDVTPFQVTIEQEEGTPCPCHHKKIGATPVSIGPDAKFGTLGAGLALHPDRTTLYSANPASSNLSTFTVAPDCGLKLSGKRIAAPTEPSDIQVKPDGHCLAVPSPVTNTVAMYRIGAEDALTPGGEDALTPAGQFPVPGPGRATGVEFSGSVVMDSLYVTKADADKTVVVRFHVRPDCGLEPNPAVTAMNSGRTSNLAELDPENRCLFVPNQVSSSVSLLAANHPPSTLTTFRVDPITGDLALVATVDDVAFYPAGLAFADSHSGQRFLYYTSFAREILRRPVIGCLPGAVLEPGIRTGVKGTGLGRALTIIQ